MDKHTFHLTVEVDSDFLKYSADDEYLATLLEDHLNRSFKTMDEPAFSDAKVTTKKD